MKKYVNNTPVEAIQVNEENYAEVREFIKKGDIGFGIFHKLETQDEILYFKDSDYIIKYEDGRYRTCKEKDFKKMYKEVEK